MADPGVGTGVAGSIQCRHLMNSRRVSRVAFTLAGSVVTQAGGEEVYSSASAAKVCPFSCNTSSVADACNDATATAPPDPPYSVSLTMTRRMSRASPARAVRESTALTLAFDTQMRR